MGTGTPTKIILITMTLTGIITAIASILLLHAIFAHYNDVRNDKYYFAVTREHLHNPDWLKYRGRLLFCATILNALLAITNLLYLKYCK